LKAATGIDPFAPHSARGRVSWIDAAKGLGIVLIVLGHITSVESPSALYVYIYAFHVPLFFFISGLTLKPGREPFGAMLKGKIRSLLLPYFCYALLGYLFYILGYGMAQVLNLKIEQFNYGPWHPLLGVFIGTLGDGNLVNTPVWFVIALFCTFVIGYAINTWMPSMVLRWVVVILLATAGYLASREVKLPWSLSSALVGLAFFQAGHAHARRFGLEPFPRRLLWPLFAITLLISLFSFLNGFVTLADMELGHPALYGLFAFGGLYLTLALVQLLGPSFPWLVLLGQWSMAIMVIHMLIIKTAKVALSGALHMSIAQIEASWMPSLAVLLATVILLVPSVWFMERYLPFTLGKSRVPSGRPATDT
jgi:acyltransferase